MPPEQCPACGRFLKNDLVAALASGPVDCPGCGEELTAQLLGGGAAPAVEDDATPAGDAAPDEGATPGDAAPDADEGASSAEDASVRPPDLPPDDVRPAPDVLAGWDVGVGPEEVASWQLDEQPFPTDAVVVGGAGVLGLVVGALVDDEHRVRGAVAGGVLGVLLAAIVRRVWRLEP